MVEKTLEQRITALEAELAAAKEEAAAKEKAAAEAGKEFKLKEPWKRFDPTAAMGMPASAVEAMVKVVPDFRGIAAEQRPVSVPGMFPDKPSGVVRGSGWRDPAPLKAPSGIKVMDQMMDVEDALDRKALERRLGVDRGKGAT